MAADGRASAVWSFEAFVGGGKSSASSLVGADYNCDGFSDIGLPGSVLLGRKELLPKQPAATMLDLGELMVPELVRDPSDLALDWSYPKAAADVDGDGCADLTVQVSRRAALPTANIPVRLFYRGGRDIATRWAATSRISHRAEPIGDINEDGYADVADCASFPPDSPCYVYAGGPNGLKAQPLLVFPHYDGLIGGADADGDTHDDLVGWVNDDAGLTLEESRAVVALYRGPLTTAPSSPAQTWRVPGFVNASHLDDIDLDGAIDVWGTTNRTESTAEMWSIAGAGAQRAKLRTWAVHQEACDGTFVPGVGPRRAGILALKTERWPDYSFAQTAYPFQVVPALSKASRFASHYVEFGLKAIGDFNADGWDDLFVVRKTDDNDALGEVYFGGSRWFTIAQPGSSFQLPPFPVSPFD